MTPRSNKRTRKIRTSTRKPNTRSNATSSKSLESGPAEPFDLEDVCSDLSSVSSSPRQGFTVPIYGLERPSQSPNTSSNVESGPWPLERATPAEIPTRALQATGNRTCRTRILFDTLVRDVEIPPTTPLAILDRHHRTPNHFLLWTTCLYTACSSHLYSPGCTPSILATTSPAVSE